MQASAILMATAGKASHLRAVPAGPALAAQTGSLDEEALQAVLGPKNQDFYLLRFLRWHGARTRLPLSWHWPALFFTWYWLLYRKMWGWALFYALLPTVAALLAAVVAGMTSNRAAGVAALAVYAVTLFIVPPLCASGLYFRHCVSLLRAQARSTTSRERYLARLEAKGGTSNAVAIAVSLLLAVALAGMLAAIAIPAYHDYTQRAKLAQAVGGAMAVAWLVGEQYEKTGALPSDLNTLPGRPAPHALVRHMAINPATGGITILIALDAASEPASIHLEPTADGNRHLTWTCHAAPGIARWAPRSCRAGD